MAEVVWSEQALDDLENIAAYIALDKPTAAQEFVQKVFDRVDKLEIQPESGRRPQELGRKSIYRELVIGPCRLFYRLEKEKLLIVHVMRSERELRRYLLQDSTAK